MTGEEEVGLEVCSLAIASVTGSVSSGGAVLLDHEVRIEETGASVLSDVNQSIIGSHKASHEEQFHQL